MYVVPNWTANSNCTFLCISHIGKALVQNWIYPVGLLSVLSNLLVLISSGLILKSKVHPRSTYMYLGNLALADLLHGTIFLSILTFYPTIKEGTSCVCIIGMTGSYVIECSFSVCLIAIDRYIYIHHGLYYSRWMTTKRTRYLLLCSWTLSLTIGSIPQILTADRTSTEEVCSFFKVTPFYVMILLSTAGLIPIFVTICLYILIFKTAFKTNKAINTENQRNLTRTDSMSKDTDNKNTSSSSLGDYNINNQHSENGEFNENIEEANQFEEANEQTLIKVNNDSRTMNLNKTDIVLSINNDTKKERNVSYKTEDASNKEISDSNKKTSSGKETKNKKQNMIKKKSTMIVFLAMCSFTVTWGPCFICLMLYPLFCYNHTENNMCSNIGIVLLFIVINVGLINALMNPIIYCWWHKGFRKSVTRVCFKKAAREKSRNDFVVSLRNR